MNKGGTTMHNAAFFAKRFRRVSLVATALLAVLAVTGRSGSAETLVVSQSGTFSADTPTTAYSTPGGTFSYTFDINSNPTIEYSASGVSFIPAISNFSYTLNGVTSTPASGAQFYNYNYGGLLAVCFGSNCGVEPYNFFIGGAQAFSGDESDPTILPGSYTPDYGSFHDVATGDYFSFASESNVDIAPTPEPGSLALLGTGLAGIGTLWRRQRAAV